MLRFWLVLAIAGFAQNAGAAQLDGPLEPAAKGQMLCVGVDAAKKTCRSTVGYRINASGAVESITSVAISGGPLVTMETIATVEVRGNRMCSLVSTSDVQGANFTVDGRSAEMKQSAQYAHQALEIAKPLLGRFVCTAFVKDGEATKTKTHVDGTARPEMDQTVAWIALDDGYKIIPAAN